MKSIVCAAIILFATVSQADVLVKYKDGTATVFPGIWEKGSNYCGYKQGIELCSPKSDVAWKKEVPEGTDASEYVQANTAGLQDKSDNMYAAEYEKDQAEYSKRRTASEKEEKQAAKDRARKVLTFGESKVRQMEVSGNSVR